MQNLKKGFKDPSVHLKVVLGAQLYHQTWNLGSNFCKIDEKDLTESALLKKKKVSILAPGRKKESMITPGSIC